MKNPIKFTWLWFAFVAATVLSSAQAQTPAQKKEVTDLTASFQAAYNKGDAATLAKMFAEKVELTNPDGSIVTRTNVQMGENYAKNFAAYDLKSDILIQDITALPDGKMRAVGTFTNAGTNKTTGEKMSQKGTFDNVFVKVNEQWSVCSMKLVTAK